MRALLTIIAVLTVATPAHAADPGRVQRFTYGSAHWLLYTPKSLNPRKPAPLLVMTHGCNTTAEQQMAANLYNPLAERKHFYVAYTDNDDGAHPGACWRFYSPLDWTRDQGDVAMIAGITRAAFTKVNVDRRRVYEIGMSSGALITSDLAAAYPDLYAAIGIMAGGPYEGFDCVGVSGPQSPSDAATAAYSAEGAHRRVMPFIVLHGDNDHTVAPACGDRAVQQWLRTDNLVLSGGQTAPLALAPASVTHGKVPKGYTYDVRHYRDAQSCEVGQRWVIHGMDHFWSGGTTDPKYAAFTDPKGPSAAKASWRFFSRLRLRHGLPRCRG